MTPTSFWKLSFVFLAVGAFSQWSFLGPGETPSRAHTASIPHTLGSWQGQDIALDERAYEILETRDVLFRRYQENADRPAVDLCIVFSQGNRKASHPPEVCYIGAGAHVDKYPPQRMEIAGLPQGSSPYANTLLVGQGSHREAVLYWYLAGSSLTHGYLHQQMKILWAQLLGRPAQGALIRCSTPLGEGESLEDALKRLRSFAQENLPVIVERLILLS